MNNWLIVLSNELINSTEKSDDEKLTVDQLAMKLPAFL
jgi:hypothetical protein